MERKRRISFPPGGTPVDVTEIGFRPKGEYWNEYLLDDGTVARVKLVVTTVYRLDRQVDYKGQPVYRIEFRDIVVVSPPEKEEI